MAALDETLLDFGAQRPRFHFDLRQAFKECFKFLWSQVRHAERLHDL